jgi:hypothetical protein
MQRPQELSRTLRRQKGRILGSLVSARKQHEQPDSRSDVDIACEQAVEQGIVKAKRSDLRNGLTCRQRMFILEKLVGRSDKDAALSAGYSSSVAENTKQRIWKLRVRKEFERLAAEFRAGILQKRRD